MLASLIALDSRFLLKFAAPDQQSPLFSMRDGTEKEFRMAMDDIRKLIGAGKEKGLSYGQPGE